MNTLIANRHRYQGYCQSLLLRARRIFGVCSHSFSCVHFDEFACVNDEEEDRKNAMRADQFSRSRRRIVPCSVHVYLYCTVKLTAWWYDSVYHTDAQETCHDIKTWIEDLVNLLVSVTLVTKFPSSNRKNNWLYQHAKSNNCFYERKGNMTNISITFKK